MMLMCLVFLQDMALRCLCQYQGPGVEGSVLALCCHHRCTWDSYCGLEALKVCVYMSGGGHKVLGLCKLIEPTRKYLGGEGDCMETCLEGWHHRVDEVMHPSVVWPSPMIQKLGH